MPPAVDQSRLSLREGRVNEVSETSAATSSSRCTFAWHGFVDHDFA